MSDFTGWQYYKNPLSGELLGIKIEIGNVQQSRLLIDPEVAKWIAEGNTPEAAE